MKDMDKIGCEWPREVDRALVKAIATYKRDVGQKKRRGVMSQMEGKRPYNLFGYITMCKYFCGMCPSGNKTTWNEGLFAAMFQKLSVNTIGRSDNIDDVMLSNIDWENDALTICFGTTKADQTGERTADRKRMYANPFKPELCVVLQLAVYTWCKRRGVNEGVHLFDGIDQNKRYYNILKDALKNIPANVELGCNRCDIGTHSNRKFAESTSVSKIDGPTKVMVCLRAGQGVGKTQDSYMYSEDEGDAFVGRTVAQLKLDADEYDVLAPHFDIETLNYLSNYGWEKILDGYDNYPPSFKRAVPYLLASLVYHSNKGHMLSLFDARHPIFFQRVFTNGMIKSFCI